MSLACPMDWGIQRARRVFFFFFLFFSFFLNQLFRFFLRRFMFLSHAIKKIPPQ